jgi:hypothetical protein
MAIDLLKTLENEFVHTFQYQLHNDQIQNVRVDCEDVNIIEAETPEMAQAWKLIAYKAGMSIRSLGNAPATNIIIVLMEDSEHGADEYDCGITIRTAPTLDGVNVNMDIMYSSEYFIENGPTADLEGHDGKVILAYAHEKSDPQSVFTSAIRTVRQNEESATILALQSQFPIDIPEKNPIELSGIDEDTFALHASMGVNYLIVGEITTREIANAALMAAQNGITVFGWIYAPSAKSASRKFIFKQNMFTSSEQSFLEELIHPITHSDLIEHDNKPVELEGVA